MQTAELTGTVLDYWVARGEAHKWRMGSNNIPQYSPASTNCWQSWRPSTSWAQGGPIIERERIQLSAAPSGEWIGVTYVKGKLIAPEAPTPLVAAMRAYVASKFGDMVEDAQLHGVEGGDERETAVSWAGCGRRCCCTCDLDYTTAGTGGCFPQASSALWSTCCLARS